jgi:hypothetical protein
VFGEKRPVYQPSGRSPLAVSIAAMVRWMCSRSTSSGMSA